MSSSLCSGLRVEGLGFRGVCIQGSNHTEIGVSTVVSAIWVHASGWLTTRVTQGDSWV